MFLCTYIFIFSKHYPILFSIITEIIVNLLYISDAVLLFILSQKKLGESAFILIDIFSFLPLVILNNLFLIMDIKQKKKTEKFDV